MNLLFQTRKPRHFHHEPIYYSEREDRLRKLEEQARKQLAQTTDRDKEKALNETDASQKRDAFADDIRGQFRHDRRRPSGCLLGGLMGTNMMVIALVLLLVILLFLLTL